MGCNGFRLKGTARGTDNAHIHIAAATIAAATIAAATLAAFSKLPEQRGTS
jgi:hypothetical protein